MIDVLALALAPMRMTAAAFRGLAGKEKGETDANGEAQPKKRGSAFLGGFQAWGALTRLRHWAC